MRISYFRETQTTLMEMVNINKTYTHAHQTLKDNTGNSQYENKRYTLFKNYPTPPPSFYQPLPFYRKNLYPSFFVKILKTQISPLCKDGRIPTRA